MLKIKFIYKDEFCRKRSSPAKPVRDFLNLSDPKLWQLQSHLDGYYFAINKKLYFIEGKFPSINDSYSGIISILKNDDNLFLESIERFDRTIESFIIEEMTQFLIEKIK